MRLDPAILRQCWFLAGPTASGKTDVSLILASRLNAEIVAMDSMTLYRGMDIGTAKPALEDRAKVPHWLFDILDPWEEFSVHQYLEHADHIVRDILGRGRVPLFVGGTGLYLRSLLRGVFDGPAADWSIRHRWEQFATQYGDEALHRELARVDPLTAARLPVTDHRRIIRALEVHELTGKTLADLQQNKPLSIDERPQHVYWMFPDRTCRVARIHQRVIAMLNAGWIEEVQQLLADPRGLSHTAGQALGYFEIAEFLKSPTANQQQLIESIQIRTRQFAKRQCTWFRNLVETTAVPVTTESSAEQIADSIIMR